MSYYLIELHKIIYCPIAKKYKIIFKTIDKKSEFLILLNNNYTKNIAMASENIGSILLSQYELFINLLTQLDLKINEVIIEKKAEGFNTVIKIDSIKKDISFNLNSYIGDAIILALKSFVSINITKELLDNKEEKNINFSNQEKKYYNLSKVIPANRESNESKILMLKTALTDCLIKENYESAAFLRDRIKILNKDK